MTSPLPGFDPTLLLTLNLLGTFVFGLSGGIAGVRARLDLFGAVVLGLVVGIAGGTIRDLLIGVPPSTFRDWRYLAIAGGAGLLASFAHPVINRLRTAIDVFDAAGLGLFAVTGAATALAHRLGVVDCVILGVITGIGGGMLRDILVRKIPSVLQGGLYAIPALVGAGIAVVGYHVGDHTVIFPIIGAAVCFALRIAGMHYGLGLPNAARVGITAMPRLLTPNVTSSDSGHEAPPPEVSEADS